MSVHLYTICWNEADMLGFFFRHYDPWIDRYVIYDDGSTDGSRDVLAAHPRVDLRRFERSDPESFVRSHTQMQNQAWKESRGTADWVVVTAIDEHLWVRGTAMAPYLRRQTEAGVTLIPALGFDMNGEEMPPDAGKLTEIVTRGRARIAFNKLGIFDPAALTETGFAAGRHHARPEGRVVPPARDELMLWHYKHLGFERNFARETTQGTRLGAIDRAAGWGHRYLWSREAQRAAWDEMCATSADLSASTFDPARACMGPLWWREGASFLPASAPPPQESFPSRPLPRWTRAAKYARALLGPVRARTGGVEAPVPHGPAPHPKRP